MGVTFVEADVAAFQKATESVRQDYVRENPEVQIYFDEIQRINESQLAKNDKEE